MSTAHRPTWDPAQARNVQGGSRQFSVRDMAAHTKLKFRQPGQTSTGEVARRDLRADLLAAEEEARNKKRKAEGRPPVAIAQRLRMGPRTRTLSSGENCFRKRWSWTRMTTDEDEEQKEASEEESEDEDEDDTDELLRELEKIKRERAEEKARQEREQLASQAAQLGQSQGLNTTVPGTFSVKRRWDDDLIFKNQAMNQREKSGQFVNDLLRTEFHKKFMAKFIKVRAWFPLALPSVQSTPTVSSFKSLLCTSLPAFSGVSPSSLCLSIDGFELLDNSELTVVRDGDLICVDVLDARTQDGTARGLHATQKRLEAATSHKRKRRESETKSTTSPSASESESESESSESDSTSDSDDSSRPGTPSLRKAEPPKIHASERALIQPKPHVVHPYVEFSADLVFWSTTTSTSTSFVPPWRMHEREGGAVSEDGPVSGANAQVEGITPAVSDAGDAYPGLLSLSLRNKNKAKNFKSLLGRTACSKDYIWRRRVSTNDISASVTSTDTALVTLLAAPKPLCDEH
ncbi:Cwf15/Cwc15 cell cycle control protein-domain-containing protein [Butyriboletus roseoflavus]|nr:Cwf15/Cwc15 cell cycle control protein-domain-containing protein [Butyriboletus roseoflavus]